jgi:hypothetical protein
VARADVEGSNVEGRRLQVDVAKSLVAAVAAFVLASPSAALACAVCFGGQDSDWTGGFLLGTTLMLLLPPLIIGGAGFAIYRAIKKQEARLRERDAERASGRPAAPSGAAGRA